MKRVDLRKLIDGKQRWTEPLTPQETAKGFKGWYSSKYLPHFDSPGAQQYITYGSPTRSLPNGAANGPQFWLLRMTWKSSDNSNAILIWVMGLVTCATRASPR